MASLLVLNRYAPADRPDGAYVDVAGTGTAWTASPSWSVSGVAGCTFVEAFVASDTSARLKVATGSATGTLTISDGANSGTVPVVERHVARRYAPPRRRAR